MLFDPRKPYNDLPLLPPRADIETGNILKQAIKASRSLAELKGIGETIPNQSLLINSLSLQEAKSSSEIENIITTNDALFRAFTSPSLKDDPAIKEVLRYREALWEGYVALKKRPILSTNLFIRIVQTIKKNQAGIRNTPGTKIENSRTKEVVYTPPEGEKVIRDKLSDLEKFIHDEDTIDPLIKLAVIHYQFEAIHPFMDGNGRTGRIINILYLVMAGLLDMPVLYASRHIIENKNKYYSFLRGVTEKKEWEPWIIFILEGIETTAKMTRDRIADIRGQMEETEKHAKAKMPARIASKEMIELLFQQPYTKIQFLVDRGIAKRQSAATYLKAFEKEGILKAHRIGKETLYLNKGLFKILSS